MPDPLHVATFIHLPAEEAQAIRDLDPRIVLHEVSADTVRWLRTPEGAAGDESPMEQEFQEILARDEVWLAFGWDGMRFPGPESPLRLVNLATAGADRVLKQNPPEGVVFTNSRGLAAPPIAEWILSFILMAAKNMPTALENQRQARWSRYPTRMLQGATVGIIGLGAIGQETARICEAFGARVLATQRHWTPGEAAPHVAELHGPDGLHGVLEASDYVVLGMPLTEETRGMIGAAEFAAMKPSAVMVNIARGAVVDWQAMLDALRSGHLGAVYTDVTVPEPLPDGDPAWSTPNLFITPHNSGNRTDYIEAACEIFRANLGRYLRGEPLANVVSRELGY